MKDILALEGQNSNVVRESVRRHLAAYEAQFRDAEPDARKKGAAAERFRRLSRDRVMEEIQRRSAISTIGHFQGVLSVIDSPAHFRIVKE